MLLVEMFFSKRFYHFTGGRLQIKKARQRTCASSGVIMQILLMCFLAMPILCSVPPEEGVQGEHRREGVKRVVLPRVSSLPRVVLNPYDVNVQFKDSRGAYFQLNWDIFGVLYDEKRSADALLEENLTLHNGATTFVSTELNELIFARLEHCVRKGTYVSYSGDGLPNVSRLESATFRKMLIPGETKVWKKLPLGESPPIKHAEMRVLFSTGGFRCFRSFAPMDSGQEEAEQRERAALGEQEAKVFEEIDARVQKKAYNDTLLFVGQGLKIEVSYVTPKGRRGVVWNIKDAVIEGRSLHLLLRDCLLQGTSHSYQDDKERHYAFCNHTLTKALRTCLASDISAKANVSTLTGQQLLDATDLETLPDFVWRVTPRNAIPCTTGKKWASCTLTMTQERLEGVPFACACEGCKPAESEQWSTGNYYQIFKTREQKFSRTRKET